MKKLLPVLALVFALVLTCTPYTVHAEENALTALQEKGEVVIECEGTYSPWNYYDEVTGELMGYDVEVARAIAGKLGIEPVFRANLWDGLFQDLDTGRCDLVVASVEPTEERALKYNFSMPYAYTSTVLIVKKGNEEIKSFEDLKGKTTCNTITSVYAMMAEEYGANVMAVDDLAQTMELVITGRSDATLNADTAFYDYLRGQPDAPLTIVDATDDPVTIVIPLPKDEKYQPLMDAINQAIEELGEEGVLSELSNKYFGGDISKPQ